MEEPPSGEESIAVLDGPPGISISAAPQIQPVGVNGNGQEPQHGAAFSRPENTTDGRYARNRTKDVRVCARIH